MIRVWDGISGILNAVLPPTFTPSCRWRWRLGNHLTISIHDATVTACVSVQRTRTTPSSEQRQVLFPLSAVFLGGGAQCLQVLTCQQLVVIPGQGPFYIHYRTCAFTAKKSMGTRVLMYQWRGSFPRALFDNSAPMGGGGGSHTTHAPLKILVSIFSPALLAQSSFFSWLRDPAAGGRGGGGLPAFFEILGALSGITPPPSVVVPGIRIDGPWIHPSDTQTFTC